MTASVVVNEAVEQRARRSLGTSNEAIYQMVLRVLDEHHLKGDVIVDVGCGTGLLHAYLKGRFTKYIGVDVVRYENFPNNVEFRQVNLDTGETLLPAKVADVVIAVETIEHLENSRAFIRELVRLAKPDGWVIVTTPNQLSLLSLLSLVVKRRFAAFQDKDYPAHLTALLEVDLQRIALECGLQDIKFAYSHHGRVVYTPWHYPAFFSRWFPRALSDNLLLLGRKPDG